MATAAAKKSTRKSKEPKAGRPIMPPIYGMGKRKKGTMKWADVCKKLEEAHNYWIATARADGRAHAMPVWGFWMDGEVFFGTGRDTVKGRNLKRSPHAIVHLESGDDAVIMECRVTEADLSDQSLRKRLNAASEAKYKMPIVEDAASAMFRAKPKVVLAWREKDFPVSATRFVLE